VKTIEADLTTKKATIVFDTPATEEKIKSLLEEINYPVVN
jgi:copper chaperone CopZ